MLEALLRRDRVLVSVALAAIAALAWAYLFWLSANMGMGAEPEMPGMGMPAMDMPDMDMPGMLAPEFRPWSATDFAFTFGMWAVMMVGMMTPSAAPMVLVYAAVGRQAFSQGKPFAATGWFLTGYLLVWVAFALVHFFDCDETHETEAAGARHVDCPHRRAGNPHRVLDERRADQT